MSPAEGSAHGRDSSPAAGSESSDPVPILGRVRDDAREDTNNKNVREDDQMGQLAKSLPSQTQALAPEPQENAMLGPLNAKSANGDGHQAQDRHENGARDEEGGGHTETSPLLGERDDDDEPVTAPAAQTEQQFILNTNPGRFWLIFAVVLINLFISAFDGTIMASSHPVITSHFHAANSASWLSTSFLLTSTAFQPLLGRLSDAVGRKPLFVGCSVIFLLSTLWCALAGSIEGFIAARAVCGLGAGGAGTLGSIITSDLVPIERRGAYQAYINVTVGVGGALGAALGGALAEALGWRWEFGVQLPFLAFVILIAMLAIPNGLGVQEDRQKNALQALKEFDSVGSLLLSVCITFLILGLNLGGNVLPWSHPFVITSLVVFIVGAPAFVYVESTTAKPIMPLKILTTAPRANLVFSNFIAATLTNAIVFNLPLYFQAVLLSSATDSGLRLVVPTIIASLVGAFTGFAITWSRRLKWPSILGTGFFLIGCISLTLLRRNLPELVYELVLIPSSVGQGFQFPGSFMALLASSEQSEQAVITSTLILWRSLGLVVGVAYSSLVVQNALRYYLNIYIDDVPNKEDIIAKVRRSVELVSKLEEPLREQVVLSYEAALRVTFISCCVIAAISLLLIIPIKLPRLPKRK